MASVTTTAIDLGRVVIREGEFGDKEVVTFAGIATLAAGCILARDSVSLKLVPYVKGGSTNQNGIPKAVLTEALTSTGAGDFPARPLISGVVNKNRLVINADGNSTNVDKAVEDQLRAEGIIVILVDQVSS
jgi:hypothetical protein